MHRRPVAPLGLAAIMSNTTRTSNDGGLCLPEIHQHRRSHRDPSSLAAMHSARSAPITGMFSLPGTHHWSCESRKQSAGWVQRTARWPYPAQQAIPTRCCILAESGCYLSPPAGAILLCCLYTSGCGDGRRRGGNGLSMKH